MVLIFPVETLPAPPFPPPLDAPPDAVIVPFTIDPLKKMFTLPPPEAPPYGQPVPPFTPFAVILPLLVTEFPYNINKPPVPLLLLKFPPGFPVPPDADVLEAAPFPPAPPILLPAVPDTLSYPPGLHHLFLQRMKFLFRPAPPVP